MKEKLAQGENAYIITGLTHSDDIDAIGPIGIDAVWLEGEHGAVDPADLGNLTRACDIWGMTSIVRVNKNDQALIYRTLDRGAQGIVVPHVNSKEEAQNVVDGGKFSPLGNRGMFTSRQGYGVPNYFKVANEETLLIALIEDIVAVRNLDEILTVEEIDVFFIAPADLAASMGHIGNKSHPDVQETIDSTLLKIVAAGRTVGTVVNNQNVSKYVSAGVRVLLTSVNSWIVDGATEFMKRAENTPNILINAMPSH